MQQNNQIAAPPLGTYAKSSSPPPDPRAKAQETRAKRYELQAAARLLFSEAGRKKGLEYGHDFHRTAKCKHINRAPMTSVHRDKEHGAAFYSGLVTCGSVWTCPICAAVVQERRREEIAKAIDYAYTNGLQPVMVTFTFPHQSWDKLDDLLARQSDAFRRLRSGKAWQKIKTRMGYQGLIRSLELTHGECGWHPHTHEIWLVSSSVEALELREELVTRWANVCDRVGLLPSGKRAAFMRHAVDVKGWCSASDYLAKQDDSRHWGVDREMAKASTKAGKLKGVHPFSFLASFAEGDQVAGARYLDYAAVIKGKRQIFWSRGLKQLIGLDDLSDEDLAEESRETADLLGSLTLDEWRQIRQAGKRADVLDAAEKSGWQGITTILDELQAAQAGQGGEGVAGGCVSLPHPVALPKTAANGGWAGRHSPCAFAVRPGPLNAAQAPKENAATGLASESVWVFDSAVGGIVNRVTGELRHAHPPPS